MKTFVIPSIKRVVAPTANENLSAGYPIGQHWFDTTTGKEYYHSRDGVWEHFATTHEALPDKNSEAAFQHVDTTVAKPTLDEEDMVAIKDSVTGKIVLTSKSNLLTEVTAELALKELKVNKQNSLAPDGTGMKFPTVDAVNAGLGAKANVVQEAWITPTLINEATGASIRYYKDQFGIVRIKGNIICKNVNMPQFNLPVGYRPASGASLYFPCAVVEDATSMKRVDVSGAGAVTTYFAGAISLNSITFRAES